MATFEQEKRAAEGAIKALTEDRANAVTRAPALIAVIDSELAARRKAFDTGCAAAELCDQEEREFARAKAMANMARAALNASTEVDRKLVETLIREVEVTKQVEQARARRVEAARTMATSQLGRAAKDVGDRNRAVDFAERLAGATIDRDPSKIPALPSPGTILWLRIVLPVEGRAAFERSAAARTPSQARYLGPAPDVAEFDRECSALWSRVESERERAANHAAALGALT